MKDSTQFARIVAEDQDSLTQVLSGLDGADAIGLDVEMGQRIRRLPGGVTKGEQILALIQIAGNGVSLIVDPVRLAPQLQALAPLLASDTVKVVLGGATDIQLLEDHGLPVNNVVDLAEVAISVFGHKEEGMRALADRALGVQINKSIRREDWLRRPINRAMLSYAHQDAELTMRLYRWFVSEHPNAVRSHQRRHYHPNLSDEIPEWIRKYITKRLDAGRLLKELRIDPEKEWERLAGDIRLAESHELSPGQQRRLLRLIGELKIKGLYDDVVPYLSSPSAVFRSSAARTLGRLGDGRARPLLQKLMADPVHDVQAAAVFALDELTNAAKQNGKEKATAIKPSVANALKQVGETLPSEPTKTVSDQCRRPGT